MTEREIAEATLAALQVEPSKPVPLPEEGQWTNAFGLIENLIIEREKEGYRRAIRDVVGLCDEQIKTGESGEMQSTAEAAWRKTVSAEIKDAVRSMKGEE
jgi:hypothetical protein